MAWRAAGMADATACWRFHRRHPWPTIDPTGGGLPLHFAALREPEHAYEFPCDAHGRVDLDGLSRRTFNDYLFARALVGWVFGVPSVHSA